MTVEPWETKAIEAGMESAEVERLAERFRDLEDGPAKWRAICDSLVSDLAAPDRNPSIAQWRAENAELRHRVAKLEQRVADGADPKEGG